MREIRTSSSMKGAQETYDIAARLCPTLLQPLVMLYGVAVMGEGQRGRPVCENNL